MSSVEYAIGSNTESVASDKKARVLCVDDEEYNLEILDKYLQDADYETICVENAHKALDVLLARKDIDAVLLDRMMPGMSGMELLEKMKQTEALADIPVIMQTAAAETSEVIEGIEAGAYYYITKPYDASILLAIIKSAIQDSRQHVREHSKLELHKGAAGLIKSMNMECRTPEEARLVATYISSNFCDDDSNALVTLTALVTNAVEHGNLGIGNELKSDLLSQNKWDEEIKSRLDSPEYADKKVKIEVQSNDGELCVTITDEGQGFNWEEYMEFDPIRMTNPSGRGLAIANVMSSGQIKFEGNGNEVAYTYPAHTSLV